MKRALFIVAICLAAIVSANVVQADGFCGPFCQLNRARAARLQSRSSLALARNVFVPHAIVAPVVVAPLNFHGRANLGFQNTRQLNFLLSQQAATFNTLQAQANIAALRQAQQFQALQSAAFLNQGYVGFDPNLALQLQLQALQSQQSIGFIRSGCR